MSTAELTADDQAHLDQMIRALSARGFVDVDEVDGMRVGTRIRAHAHQWPGAGVHGTGNVIALMHHPGRTAWSLRTGRCEVELVARWDRTCFGTRLSQLADYHVQIALHQSAEVSDAG